MISMKSREMFGIASSHDRHKIKVNISWSSLSLIFSLRARLSSCMRLFELIDWTAAHSWTQFYTILLFSGPNPLYAVEWQEKRIDDDDKWCIHNFTAKHSIINVNEHADRIPGVQPPYVLVGVQGTWFCAHIEDNSLSSINIMLEGAAKVWYVIPEKFAVKFENLVKKLLGS